MTSSAAFRCVQAWLLEKPAAWADEDAPCIAAALMAQRPPCDMLRKRPREDALLEAERSRQRARIAGLDEELLDDKLRGIELERENRNPAGGWAALTISSTEIASALSLEGVSQMAYILPERLRPAFDLVLRRIRSLKRCAQA